MPQAETTTAPDSVKADPKHYKVELENDKVRIVRISYGPHEKSVMHSHPAGAIISLTDQRVRFNLPNGTSQEVQLKAGQAVWMNATTHLPENLTDDHLEVIYVEVK